MSRKNLSSRLVALALVAVLGVALAAPAHARPAVQKGGGAAVANPLAALWSYVSRLLGGIGEGQGLRSLFGKEGAGLDPHGSPTAPSGDEGSGLDPHGNPVAGGALGGA